ERRLGPERAARQVARIALASLLLVALVAGLLLAPGRALAQAAGVDGAAIAARALDHLDAGEYAQAEAMFSGEMAKAVPADKLKAVWESLPAQVGKATGRGAAEIAGRD